MTCEIYYHGLSSMATLIIFKLDWPKRKWYYTASFSVLAYDYLLTFNEEVKEIWQRKPTLGMEKIYNPDYMTKSATSSILPLPDESILSDSIRYLDFISMRSGSHAEYFSPLWTFESILTLFPAEILMIYRVYAITAKCLPVVILLICTMVAQGFVIIYSASQPGGLEAFVTPNYNLDPFHICLLYPKTILRGCIYLIIAIFFDIIVFSITISRTINRNSLLPRTPLLRTIQRDGTIYFLVLLAGNLIWFILALFGRCWIAGLENDACTTKYGVGNYPNILKFITLTRMKASRQDVNIIPTDALWVGASNERCSQLRFTVPTEMIDTHTSHAEAENRAIGSV
ncbi:hypothetical protein BDQ12DRAFT_710744 [Crucibulum laeve]|uniref:DUF6533 domain-containing protein n=1 Tax=Crucibulum laeve TaxID=68775 RepID=A0A5C3M8X0_9AGAR|nr:hypothetical protein BDQ12DRAFT_710744 [Crucibulum laeve]